jgi:hypothetical protein
MRGSALECGVERVRQCARVRRRACGCALQRGSARVNCRTRVASERSREQRCLCRTLVAVGGLHREQEALESLRVARGAAQKAEAKRQGVQAQLEAERACIKAMRAQLQDRRSRIMEALMTYEAKREMIGTAQAQWSRHSANHATQVAVGPGSQRRLAGVQTVAFEPRSALFGSLKSRLQDGSTSLRRAMGEVRTIWHARLLLHGSGQLCKSDCCR